jgi:ribose-phosphate pyrophosphokinase
MVLMDKEIMQDRADFDMERTESVRGRLLIASCRSGSHLAQKVVQYYEQYLADGEGNVLFMPDIDDTFSDTETTVRLDMDVNGYDVFLFQSLYDHASNRSIDQNYMAFLIAARTLREWGANHVTAILPYLAYSRQDKPTGFTREPTTAKLMADLSVEAGIDRLITWHPHLEQIRGFYGRIPVNVLDATPLFEDEYRSFSGREDVIIVAPDVGASKFITNLARRLNIKSAIAAKYRPQPEEAAISEIIGDFQGKRIAIIVDDIISSGGTISALVERLARDRGIEEVYLGVSHYLCMDKARQRLLALRSQVQLQSLVVTDSIPQLKSCMEEDFLKIRSLAGPISEVIRRVHHNRSVNETPDIARLRTTG